jgi:hypothetical protein
MTGTWGRVGRRSRYSEKQTERKGKKVCQRSFVVRAPRSCVVQKIFLRALRSVCLARASVVCRMRASLLLHLDRLAGVQGGFGKMQENAVMTVAPLSRASSASPRLGGCPGWAIGVFPVEFHHDGIVVVEVAGGGPAALLGAVADPIGQVLEFPTEKARVEYAGNLVLLFSIRVDDGGRWCEGGARR